MDTNAAARALLDHAGLSQYAASLAMGRAHSYVGQSLKNKGGMSAAVLAEIANACGCDLVAVDRRTGERVAVIDPARRDQTSNEQPSTN